MLNLKTTAVMVLAAVLALAPAAVARADGYDPQPGCQYEPAPPECEIVAETPDVPDDDTTGGSSGGGCTRAGQPAPCYLPGRGWLGANGCYYAATGEPGWYRMTCDLDGGGAQASIVVQLPVAPVGALMLGQRAVSLLQFPKPAMKASPPLDRPQLTFLPIWLWVEPASWQSITATATVPGVSVTATATPVRVTWTTGDGTPPVVCAGPGTPYTAGSDPQSVSSCFHTYVRSSAGQPGQAYTLTAQVTWQVTWTGGGLSGTVPAITTTASVPVRVSEVQAVIIR